MIDPTHAAILVGGGFVAGVVNTLAGGGSLLTVPLLVFLGIPGTLANGTNRVGILVQNVISSWRFAALGVAGYREAAPVLLAVVIGSLVGAQGVSLLSNAAFERLFGVLMALLLIPMLWPRRAGVDATDSQRPRWSSTTSTLVFFAVGLYGGAFQAGVGLVLMVALERSGFDLVRANSVKAVVIAALTAVAVPVFAIKGQIQWDAAIMLSVGFAAGGSAGARLAVKGGERLIRPVLIMSVLVLAGRMLGIY